MPSVNAAIRSAVVARKRLTFRWGSEASTPAHVHPTPDEIWQPLREKGACQHRDVTLGPMAEHLRSLLQCMPASNCRSLVFELFVIVLAALNSYIVPCISGPWAWYLASGSCRGTW